MNAPTRYTGTALLLHWLVALAVFGAFPLGLYMHDLPLSPHKLQLYSYHKWIGITALALMLVRIGWRAGHRPPPLPDTMPDWQQAAARGVHCGMYLLLLAVPVSGWLMSSALGFQVVWLGLVPLPDLVGKNRELGDLLKELHQTFDYALLALVVLHAGAALKHHFVDRDDILARMLPLMQRRHR